MNPADSLFAAERQDRPFAALEAGGARPVASADDREVLVERGLHRQVCRTHRVRAEQPVAEPEELLEADAVPSEIVREGGAVLRFDEDLARRGHRPVADAVDDVDDSRPVADAEDGLPRTVGFAQVERVRIPVNEVLLGAEGIRRHAPSSCNGWCRRGWWGPSRRRGKARGFAHTIRPAHWRAGRHPPSY